MHVLEARFHPQKRNGGVAIVVGRVYCDRDDPWISAASGDAAMVTKLRYLVSANSPDPYPRLLSLVSEFWSFIEVNETEGGTA